MTRSFIKLNLLFFGILKLYLSYFFSWNDSGNWEIATIKYKKLHNCYFPLLTNFYVYCSMKTPTLWSRVLICSSFACSVVPHSFRVGSTCPPDVLELTEYTKVLERMGTFWVFLGFVDRPEEINSLQPCFNSRKQFAKWSEIGNCSRSFPGYLVPFEGLMTGAQLSSVECFIKLRDGWSCYALNEVTAFQLAPYLCPRTYHSLLFICFEIAM